MNLFTDWETDRLAEASVAHDEWSAAMIHHLAEERREIELLTAQHRIDETSS